MTRSPIHPAADSSPAVLLTRAYDHPDVQYLVQKLYAEQRDRYGYADPAEADPGMYQAPHGAFLVAYDNGHPVACGGFHTYDHSARTAEIKKMYTLPTHRGTGLGRWIIAQLEEEARKAGARRMILETGVRNTAALALYTGCGYRPASSYMPNRDPSINRAFVKQLMAD